MIGGKMQTKVKGDISEARALFEFQKRNIPVLLPWGDKERYDMVVEMSGRFYKIQVKTANEERNGAIICYTRSSHNHSTNKKYYKYTGQVDYFVFYNMVHDIIAIVPESDVGDNSHLTLRISPAKNNQKNVRYFSDYSFDKILCVETLHVPSHSREEEKVQTTIGN